MDIELLKQRQALPLDLKIEMTKKRIREYYQEFSGDVYVCFSGGKDSTVLLHIARSIYPNIKAVFSDTGLEYPEIREFVKTIENVEFVKPEKNFKKVIEEYGYPVISKMQSQYIDQMRNGSDAMKELRMFGKVYNGTRNYKISDKWKFLVNAPFKISDKCCKYLKKEPLKKFEKKTGLKPIIGIMAADSIQRQKQILQQGCNAFDRKEPQSRPLAFWTEKDIWEYIKTKNISYCKIYNMGMDRTGCMFCLYGCHLQENDRFSFLEKNHPELYKYAMEKLGLRKVINYICSGSSETLFDFS